MTDWAAYHTDPSSLLLGFLDGFAQGLVKGFDVGIQFLFKLLHSVLRCALQSLLQPRPPDDDQACRAGLKGFPNVFQIRA